MKIFTILTIYMFALLVSAESGPEPDKSIWFKCVKDSECMVAAGACGQEPVNKKYQKPFEEHAIKIMPYVDCMPMDKRKRKAICYKTNCTFKN